MMSNPDPSLSRALSMALEGTEAHVKTVNAIAGLSADQAGRKPAGVPHSIYQLMNHLVLWQDKCLEWLDGQDPAWPAHASEGWPGAERPESQDEWDGLVTRFREGLEKAVDQVDREDMYTVRDRWAPVQLLRSIASHNSYHLGQIVMLRRMLGAWPPPGGGDTW
jgi:uncharacterized damage-inducible protein DinB